MFVFGRQYREGAKELSRLSSLELDAMRFAERLEDLERDGNEHVQQEDYRDDQEREKEDAVQ